MTLYNAYMYRIGMHDNTWGQSVSAADISPTTTESPVTLTTCIQAV